MISNKSLLLMPVEIQDIYTNMRELIDEVMVCRKNKNDPKKRADVNSKIDILLEKIDLVLEKENNERKMEPLLLAKGNLIEMKQHNLKYLCQYN